MSGDPQCSTTLRRRRLIRKLWIGEAGIYRDHLLRLDPDSRHSRFGGGCRTISSAIMSMPTFG